MARTLELKGTTERNDPWNEEADGAAVALLTPEEFRALVARLIADEDPTKLTKAA
jgi:hypothetical protein